MVFAAIAADRDRAHPGDAAARPDTLGKRMKSVALEREKDPPARARAAGARRQGRAAAHAQAVHADRRRPVQPEQVGGPGRGARQLVQAGYRGQAPYVTYPVLPHGHADGHADGRGVLSSSSSSRSTSRRSVKIGMCLAAAYFGMHLPSLFLKNKIAQRQLSIKRAFPDALDLLLICVESGMSIEAASGRWSERSARSRSRSPRS